MERRSGLVTGAGGWFSTCGVVGDGACATSDDGDDGCTTGDDVAWTVRPNDADYDDDDVVAAPPLLRCSGRGGCGCVRQSGRQDRVPCFHFDCDCD